MNPIYWYVFVDSKSGVYGGDNEILGIAFIALIVVGIIAGCYIAIADWFRNRK